jgi:hypothetical protein
MLATSGMSVAAILYVMRRNRRLAAEDAARDAA